MKSAASCCRDTTASEKAVVFESGGQGLAAGQVLLVEMGRLPLPWMTYGKWAAVAIMLGLIGGASWLHFRQRRESPPNASPKTLTARNKKKRAA